VWPGAGGRGLVEGALGFVVLGRQGAPWLSEGPNGEGAREVFYTECNQSGGGEQKPRGRKWETLGRTGFFRGRIPTGTRILNLKIQFGRGRGSFGGPWGCAHRWGPSARRRKFIPRGFRVGFGLVFWFLSSLFLLWVFPLGGGRWRANSRSQRRGGDSAALSKAPTGFHYSKGGEGELCMGGGADLFWPKTVLAGFRGAGKKKWR